MSNAVNWDREADVVVIGSGATGLPAAIVAREVGASVIVVEAENHIGGHAITSGGNLPLGGGTSYQKKYGITDSPDLFFQDLTDWSVVETNGFPPYRYNDREIIRAFADNSVPAFEFLLAHGVKVIDRPPNTVGHEIGVSVRRTMQIDVADWPMVHTGGPASPSTTRAAGSTSAPSRRSSSPPAARPAMSISAACSIRGSRKNIAACPACRGRTRMRAARSPRSRLAPRYGACSTTPASSAPASPSRAPSAASTATSMCAGIRRAKCSTRRAPSACRLRTGRTPSWST